MLAPLLLLLIFHGATEAATVTLTEEGDSPKYPWPELGRFKISVTCSTSRPKPKIALLFGRGNRCRFLLLLVALF